jgi:DNA modification methylase
MRTNRPTSKTNGTPTLTWPGKHAPQAITPQAPQLVEIFAPRANATDTSLPNSQSPISNTLFYGDNLAVLTYLLNSGYGGQVKLIYIDPPFDSGTKYRRKVRLRGPKAPTMQTSADHVFGQQVQFHDQWNENSYLQFIYERLPLLRDLLAAEGSLWLHCDHRQVHHLRVLLQEVFGAENYLNTIAWRSQVARGAKVNAFYFPYSTQFIEIFARQRRAPTTWNPPKKQRVLREREADAEFMHDGRGFFRTSDPGAYTFASLKTLYQEGRLYAPFGGEIVVDEARQRVYASNGGNIGVKYYLTDLGKGKFAVERAVDNLWDDIPGLGITPGEDVGYPTQKTEALLERIITTATNPGDLVLDCFMGSGTTLAVAQRLGRRWLGCDNNYGALLTARRRLQAMAAKQADAVGFTIYQMSLEQTAAAPPIGQRLQATVEIERLAAAPAMLQVTVNAVHSPLISAQLAQNTKIDPGTAAEWRTFVDTIAIDAAYEGSVFRPALVDAPLKKSAQVQGCYHLAAPTATTRVAVRITDLLGEEVLITKEV